MKHRAVLMAALVFLAACEDVAEAVRTHPDEVEHLGKGEVQVIERKF